MRARLQVRRLVHAFLLAAVAAAVVAPHAAGAQQAAAAGQPGQPARLSVAAAIALAVDTNPLIRAYRYDVQRAQVDVDELEGFWNLPTVTLDSLSGVVPAARGDIFESADTADDLNNLGPFFKINVGLAVPIYTFGRLQHGASAARGAVSATASEGQKARDDLTLEVIRAYWGTVAGERALEVAQEMLDAYDDLVEQAEEKLDADTIDPNDAWEIKAGRYEVDRAYLDVAETLRLLRRSLATLMGYDPETPFDLTASELPGVSLSLADLPRLQQRAEMLHPQVRALDAATAALESAMNAERSNRWPVILVGGGFGFARSPNRDDQQNPFVYDEFNYTRIGAAFNVRWDLNFAKHRLNYLRRRIERDATQARRQALEMKVGIEVHQALERVLKNVKLVESARETRRDTRRWLRSAGDDFDLGIGEAQPLIKAYRADYRLQATVIESEYQLNVSLAELALAMGDLSSYLQWIADGQVALD